MKILHLSFANLNSLRGSFSIDFEKGPLAEAGLFAITGPTGVGKTTILDAITLGLFGKAARYDNNKASTPENMMSRGAGDCFSEVVFSCKKGVYSVRWDLARARKKHDGRVQSAKRQIATLNGDILETKIREVEQRVIALTGLDYNRFLRSVLLAQGRFKEFLDADRKERGELLEKITGTKIYSDLSVAAFGRAREQQAGIDKAKISLGNITLLDAETIRDYAKEQTGLGEKLNEVEKRLKLLNDRIDLHDQMIELAKEKKILSERLESWEKASSDFAPEAKRIETFDKASPLSGDLAKWKELGRKAKSDAKLKQDLAALFQKSKEQLQAHLSTAIALCIYEIETIENKRKQQQASLKEEEEQLNQISDWLETKRKYQMIETALPVLRSQGEQCRAFAQKNAGHSESIKAIKERIQKTKDSKIQLDEQKVRTNKTLSKTSDEVERCAEALRKALVGKTKSECQKDHETSRERLLQVSNLRQAQEAFISESNSLEKKRSQETLQQTKSIELEAELNALAISLQEQRDCLKDKETIHEQATAIASLKKRRAELKEGKPCDLCGSLEHPYATSELPSESETRKAKDFQIQKVDTLSAQERKLSVAAASAKTSSSEITKACNDLEERIAKNLKDFLELATKMNASLTVSDKNGLSLFENTEREKCERLSKLVKKIETNEKKLTEAEKKEVSARADINSLGDQLKQLERTENDTVNDLEKEEIRTAETIKRLAEAMEEFCESISDWVPSCQSANDTKATISVLEARSKTYIEKRSRKTDTEKQIKDLKGNSKQSESAQQRLLREKEEWEGKLLIAHMEMLPNNLIAENHNWDEIKRRSQHDTAAEAMTRSESEFKLKNNELEKATRELAELSKKLSEQALEIGLKTLESLVATLSSNEAIDALRIKQRTLENEKTGILALSEKNAAVILNLENKQLPDEEETTRLRLESESAKTQQKEHSERLVELRIDLENDIKARNEQKEQIERISNLEKDARPWLVLRDLIGSADGSAFSRFAQGLTLAQLVVYANRHLCELNPRYRIHRVAKVDLELEIIDLYEANAIRPTRSLSGGESFLVSLALALGLSELAGRNTKIESLFIDEGFGSLDTDTLDVALSALENLRLQNRTIGVISHVEELKIRIGTQIQVIRGNNGHALLNIIE